MDGATLWAQLAKHGIHLERLADKTGYSLAYLVQILTDVTPLTDSARFRIVQAFPQMANALIDKEAGA